METVAVPEYQFAGFCLAADGTLTRGGSIVHLAPKELAALRLLIERAGLLVSTEELKRAVWGEVHVSADSLPRCISSLRAQLEPENCIQTVYKRGYRLSAAVEQNGVAVRDRLPRLAIMPFGVSTFVPEYLGPAIAEETITRLSNSELPAVAVLARDSVFTLARAGKGAVALGRELEADLVLTGTLRLLFSHYLLRAEMVRIADGVQIWVEDMVIERRQITHLEDELAARLLFRLSAVFPAGKPHSGPAEKPSQTDGDEETAPHAYELYLLGHQELQTVERHRLQDGLQHLNQAIELNPRLVEAKIDLAQMVLGQAFFGYLTPERAVEQARHAAASIPDSDPSRKQILPALGWASFFFDHDLVSAERAFALSADLPHDNATTCMRTAYLHGRRRYAESIALTESALRVDPFSAWLESRLAWSLHMAGEAAASRRQVERCLQLYPEHESTALFGGIIYTHLGDQEQLRKLMPLLARMTPYIDSAASIQAGALAVLGERDEAQRLLERLEWLGRERYVIPSFLPAAWLALGERERALATLAQSERERCPWFFITMGDPRLAPLHGEPEFERLNGILQSMEQTLARRAAAAEMAL